MHHRIHRALLLGLACAMLAVTAGAGAAPQEKQPAAAPSRQEIEAVIQTLEDSEARQKLVAQLRIMAEGMEKPSEEESQVASATAEVLRSVSQRIAALGRGASEVAGLVNRLPEAVTWLETTAKDPGARRHWLVVLARLAATLGAGYVAAWIVGWLLVRPRRAAVAREPVGWLGKLAMLVALLFLELIPIAAFAGVAYLVLTFVDPLEETRLVALAWVNASIIVRLVMAVGRFVLSPDAPWLRLIPAGDETSQYLQIWLRRTTGTAVFGYFGLQAAVLLGMPGSVYEALLHLLGLVVLALFLILVAQNRQPVSDLIRGTEAEEAVSSRGVHLLRQRLAQTWHLLAAAFLIVLYGVRAAGVPDGFLYIGRATLLTVLIVLLLRGALRLLDRLFQRGLRVTGEISARFPGLEARVNRYFPVLHRALNALAYAMAALAVLEAWGLDTFAWLASEPGRVLGSAAVRIIGIVVISFALWEVASSLIERYLGAADAGQQTPARSARTRTLLSVARNALLVAIAVVSTLMVLSELGINIAPLLAGAGVLGLAVGFGAQRLVQDIITGIFILFQDLMAVGDVVKLGDRAGLVEAISIRTVRLRDLTGTVHTIPFSAINTVSNLTEEFSFYVFDMGVAYREDVDEVMDLLKRIGEELQADAEIGPLMLAPIEVFGVDAFGDSAVVIKGRLKTLPIKQWAVGRAFNRLVKKRFDEAGIEIPFPHRTVYFGEAKDGSASPAHVRVSPGITVQTPPYELLEGRGGRMADAREAEAKEPGK
jgi:small-conductance mechanosensitive channel